MRTASGRDEARAEMEIGLALRLERFVVSRQAGLSW